MTRRFSLVLLVLALGCAEQPAPVPADSASAAPAAVAPRVAGRSTSAERRNLEEDERRGGHTLERHVGLSDDDLRARLRREPRISAASTWTDRDTAERSVAAALAREGLRVERWLAREGPRPNLALDWEAGAPIGRSLRRGSRTVATVACATVVLRWSTRDDDFHVLTSYPETCR